MCSSDIEISNPYIPLSRGGGVILGYILLIPLHNISAISFGVLSVKIKPRKY